MNVSDATAGAFEAIERRESDVSAAFAPTRALPDDTYFVVARNSRLAYTREADFTVRDGSLVDTAGDAVMGYPSNDSALAPLRIDPLDRAAGAVHNARVSNDGSLVYERREIDANGMAHVRELSAGRLALARFAPGTKLQSLGLRYGGAPSGVAPHLTSASDSDVQIASIARLQEAFIAFDALRAAGKAEGGLEKTVMDLLK